MAYVPFIIEPLIALLFVTLALFVWRHSMARIAYWTCFTLVFLSASIGWCEWLLSLSGNRLPYFISTWSVLSFASLVPPLLTAFVPRQVHTVLGLVVLFLLFRRIWLFLLKGERVPSAFVGFPKVLGQIGAISFFLSAITLTLSYVLGAGVGVPPGSMLGGMLLFPAFLCVPWAFFLTELLSFRRAPVEHEA